MKRKEAGSMAQHRFKIGMTITRSMKVTQRMIKNPHGAGQSVIGYTAGDAGVGISGGLKDMEVGVRGILCGSILVRFDGSVDRQGATL